MNSTWFGEIPGIGRLTVERIFYDGEEPVLFTAKNENDIRYLCACCRLGTQYLVSPVANKALVRLIRNEITLREIFIMHDTVGITWDGNKTAVWPEIPPDMYPVIGERLDLGDREDVVAYADFLVREEQGRFVQ